MQALLGHANPNTRAHYAHITGVTEKDSMTIINNLIDTLHVDFRKLWFLLSLITILAIWQK